MDDRLTQLSKTIAYVLRHNPDAAALSPDPAGWVAVDELLAGLRTAGHDIAPGDLATIVADADGRRYQMVDGRIRATHGHSIEVDLDLAPTAPPAVLFHGTVSRFLAAIGDEGLTARRRQYVHLAPTPAMAATVGARRGDPTVLTVDAAGMHRDGHAFYRTPGGVWLTATVPAAYLSGLPGQPDTAI